MAGGSVTRPGDRGPEEIQPGLPEGRHATWMQQDDEARGVAAAGNRPTHANNHTAKDIHRGHRLQVALSTPKARLVLCRGHSYPHPTPNTPTGILQHPILRARTGTTSSASCALLRPSRSTLRVQRHTTPSLPPPQNRRDLLSGQNQWHATNPTNIRAHEPDAPELMFRLTQPGASTPE